MYSTNLESLSRKVDEPTSLVNQSKSNFWGSTKELKAQSLREILSNAAHGWTLRTLHSVRQSRQSQDKYSVIPLIWGLPKAITLQKPEDGWLPGERWKWGLFIQRLQFLVLQDELKLLNKMSLWLKLLNCTLKIVKMVECYFLQLKIDFEKCK